MGGFKITADGDCSREIKRRLLLGRKAMTKLDSILKSRDNTLTTKVCLVKDMVFPVVMHGYGPKKKSCMGIGPKRRLSTEELMVSNCSAAEDS